jgi:hypothetical protein
VGRLKYLAMLKSLPNAKTGQVKVVAPTLYGDQVVTASPMKEYLGIMQPYSLDEVVFVEIVEGVLYYSERLYANGEYSTPVPNAYTFATPNGYIAFTSDSVIIRHRDGSEWVLSGGTAIPTAKTPFSPTKWR